MRKTIEPFIYVVLAAAIFAGWSCGPKHPPLERDLDEIFRTGHIGDQPPFDGRIQVVAFNIERGFHRGDVAAYISKHMAEVPATVVLLSECDRYHGRTDDAFVADEIGAALGMDVAYVTEFVEYNDPTPETQGDHGNAVLSPFPMEDVTAIRHTVVHSWERWGWLGGEPRAGNRVALGTTVVLPNGARLRVYSVHFESQGDTIGKWVQMQEVLADADKYDMPAVIGGDYNEIPGGLMFAKLPGRGFANTFAGDNSLTGSCKPKDGKAGCSVKIDWIVHRGLEVEERHVDYDLNSEGGVMSDHAPVRAIFTVE